MSDVATAQLIELNIKFDQLLKLADETFIENEQHINDNILIDRNLFDSLILSWNVNSINSHMSQFKYLYNKEKPSCVILNEHKILPHGRPILPGLEMNVNKDCIIATSFKCASRIPIPYGICSKVFLEHINQWVYIITLYSEVEKSNVLMRKLYKIFNILKDQVNG